MTTTRTGFSRSIWFNSDMRRVRCPIGQRTILNAHYSLPHYSLAKKGAIASTTFSCQSS